MYMVKFCSGDVWFTSFSQMTVTKLMQVKFDTIKTQIVVIRANYPANAGKHDEQYKAKQNVHKSDMCWSQTKWH